MANPVPPHPEPEWFQGLQWVIAAALLALASIGPKLFGPIIERWKASLPSPAPISPTIGQSTQMAIVGAAFADRDAMLQLASAMNRLADVMEAREARENEIMEKLRLATMVEEAIERLNKHSNRD